MNNNRLSYKNFSASIEFSADDGLLVGRVEDIESLILFSGSSIEEVRIEFERAIDEYLAHCERLAVEPEKTFKGTFNVRVGTDLHRKASLAARRLKCSLNDFVRMAIERELSPPAPGLVAVQKLLEKEVISYKLGGPERIVPDTFDIATVYSGIKGSGVGLSVVKQPAKRVAAYGSSDITRTRRDN